MPARRAPSFHAGILAACLALATPGIATAQTTGLTHDLLKNATYPSVVGAGGRSITLHDGRFEERTQLSNAGVTLNVVTTVTFIDAAIGPEYAAVVIASNGGGSGTFIRLHLVTGGAGTVTAGPGAALGDRVSTERPRITDRGVQMDVVTQGPGEPLCCPTQRETREFAREGNEFRLISTVVTQPSVSRPPERSASGPPQTGRIGLASPVPPSPVGLALATLALVLLARRIVASRP